MDHRPGESFDVAVVGGGPAGMTAAIFAAREGARVVLLEQLEDLGRKLRATGGGRCNLTNTLDRGAFLAAFGEKRRFVRPAVAAFDNAALRAFFDARGVPTASPDGVHVFPASDSALSVSGALLGALAEAGVELRTGAGVERIERAEGAVLGIVTAQGAIEARAVVLAAGGKSYPGLGGTGSGFALAAVLGHAIVTPVPALVGLVVAEEWVGACAGIVLPAATLRIDLPGGAQCGGELLFTHRGISGPAVLDLSGAIAALLLVRESVPLALDLTPDISREEWGRRVAQWQKSSGRKMARSMVSESLPHALAENFVTLAGLDKEATCAHLTREHRERLATCITALPLTVVATEGFQKAMVTRGGVALQEVDSRTLASRLVNGIFFAGEVLDIDGPCGGYNLQWAFSSGRLAGIGAAAARGSGRTGRREDSNR